MQTSAQSTQPTPAQKAHITIRPFDGIVTVSHADAVIASSDNALVLEEGSYDPVYYLPFKDIYFERLLKSDTTSHCRHKGTATYWSVNAVGDNVKDAMWAYENPYEKVAAIAGHGAFVAGKLKIDAGPAEEKPLPIG